MTDLSIALEDARLSDGATSDDTRAEREAERAARRQVRTAAPLPGQPAIEERCPHCLGTGVLRQISRQERQRLNDAFLRNRRPGDPLPNRVNALPQGSAMQVHSGGEAELRRRADSVLDIIETDGRLAPRRTQEDGLIAWGSDGNAGTSIV